MVSKWLRSNARRSAATAASSGTTALRQPHRTSAAWRRIEGILSADLSVCQDPGAPASSLRHSPRGIVLKTIADEGAPCSIGASKGLFGLRQFSYCRQSIGRVRIGRHDHLIQALLTQKRLIPLHIQLLLSDVPSLERSQRRTFKAGARRLGGPQED